MKGVYLFLRVRPHDSRGDERTPHKDISPRLRCLLVVHLWGLSCTQSIIETRVSLVTIDHSVHLSLLRVKSQKSQHACIHTLPSMHERNTTIITHSPAQYPSKYSH